MLILLFIIEEKENLPRVVFDKSLNEEFALSNSENNIYILSSLLNIKEKKVLEYFLQGKVPIFLKCWRAFKFRF